MTNKNLGILCLIEGGCYNCTLREGCEEDKAKTAQHDIEAGKAGEYWVEKGKLRIKTKKHGHFLV